MQKPLQFGSVKIGVPVVLAPMAGYTDSAMRTLCLEHGAGAVYSELTSAEGIRRDSEKTFQVLETSKSEHPIAGHIFGRDPQAMAEAAKYVEQTGLFDWIDINCGCPVKKVVSRGAGAALMKDLPLLAEIIGKVKAAVSLPVSVKTRIGFNNEDVPAEIVKLTRRRQPERRRIKLLIQVQHYLLPGIIIKPDDLLDRQLFR